MTTPKATGADRANGDPRQDQTKRDAASIAQPGDERQTAKLAATLRAQLALAGGFTLLELSGGGFLIHKWNLSRHCADLREVAAFVRQIGGAS